MTLPAGVLPSSIAMVDLSIDGTTWTDVSDQASVLNPPVQTRVTGQLAVFGEDTMIATAGKREPVEVTIRGPYVDTTTTTNAFVILLTQWETDGGGEMNVRWAPSGTSTDALYFATGTATGGYSKLVSLTYPGGDANTADPLVYEAVIRTPEIHHAAKS